MLNILTLSTFRSCLKSVLSSTNIDILFELITASFCVSYGVTTRSMSRYTAYSLRTLFRFLGTPHDWVSLRVQLFERFCRRAGHVYLLVADETVEDKSGKESHGIGYFYSSIIGKPIRGLCFFGLSLVSVQTGVSYFLSVGQVVRTAAEKAVIEEKKVAKRQKKGQRKGTEKGGNSHNPDASGTEGTEGVSKAGRKKGRKNKAKEENQTASYRVFKSLFINVLNIIRRVCGGINVPYLVVDSAYGTADYLALTRQQGLHLISKLKSNTLLVYPYAGEQKGKRPKLYGDKIDLGKLSDSYLKEVKVDDDGKHNHHIYQLLAYAKNAFGATLLNIVIIRTQRKEDAKVSTTILFSSDLDLGQLGFAQIIQYYGLRFQIEFDFRDAKQHFGLSDFKNYKESQLTNFVNLVFTTCLVSKIYVAQYREELKNPNLSVIDLKLIHRGRYIAKNVLKLVHKQPDRIFNDDLWLSFVPNDLINRA